ncbi:MAG TPA: hypothetical protein PLL76_01145 [Thermoanaerobaculia bacterium]|nr:hypothetical protein [Thermoanaerobaculia bacterium]HQP84835.1 hypothetical protein [Thermoanaerobaculia bacterium]
MRAAARSLAALLAGVLLLSGRPAAAEHVTLPAGARLHRDPVVTSPSLVLLDEEALVEVFERQDGWILVRYDTFRGWVREGAPRSLLEERGEPDAPRGWVPRNLLARGRALLRNGGRELPMDGRTLLTDVSDETLLKWLVESAVATRVAFEKFWGKSEPAPPGSIVFLFESAEAERKFSSVACGVAGPPGTRVVSLALSGEGREGERARLLHQIGHLYVRDLLGEKVPAWIEEGLAHRFVQASRSAESRPAYHPKRAPAPKPAPTIPEILAAGPEIFLREPAAEAMRREARWFFEYLERDWKTFGKFKGFVMSGGPFDAPALEKAIHRSVRSMEKGFLVARELLP